MDDLGNAIYRGWLVRSENNNEDYHISATWITSLLILPIFFSIFSKRTLLNTLSISASIVLLFFLYSSVTNIYLKKWRRADLSEKMQVEQIYIGLAIGHLSLFLGIISLSFSWSTIMFPVASILPEISMSTIIIVNVSVLSLSGIVTWLNAYRLNQIVFPDIIPPDEVSEQKDRQQLTQRIQVKIGVKFCAF